MNSTFGSDEVIEDKGVNDDTLLREGHQHNKRRSLRAQR